MAQEVIRTRKRSTKPRVATTGDAPEEAHTAPVTAINADRRRSLIAEAAYYRSLRRATPGSDIDDWLAAEKEVDAKLMAPLAQ
jgi:hypothetical protein